MHDSKSDEPSGDDFLGELPDEIVTRLRSAERGVPIVAPRADRGVLDAARDYFAARPRRAAVRTRRWAVPLAAAATILIAVLIVRPFDTFRDAALADDVDGSGRVDILDAFALARTSRGDAGALAEELAQRVVSLAAAGDVR